MMTDLLTIQNMNIKALALGDYQTNCYIISRADTGQAVVIDPGDETERIAAYIRENGLKPEAILLTHGHFDHIFAAEDIRRAFECPIYAHEEERALLLDPSVNCSADFNRPVRLRADSEVVDGQILKTGGFVIRVIATPGHTAGSVCYLFEEYQVLASGDTLFLESVGRTDLPTGSMKSLLDSIRNRLMKLPDKILILPGHGDRTTIGYERKENPFL